MFEQREPAETIKFVDDYCQWYKKIFPEVRSFEAFKYLHVGMISEIKRKTLPEIARSHLSIGFLTLIALMNRMRGAIPDTNGSEFSLFLSP